MKIHMDYLEHKLEQYSSRDQTIIEEVDHLQSQLDTANDKVKMIKEAKQREQKEFTKKLEESKRQQKTLLARIAELEQQTAVDSQIDAG